MLLALCGCNGILGLGDVVERPPVDARQLCPTGTAPVFRNSLHQIPMAAKCIYTSVADTGGVMAMCGPLSIHS